MQTAELTRGQSPQQTGVSRKKVNHILSYITEEATLAEIVQIIGSISLGLDRIATLIPKNKNLIASTCNFLSQKIVLVIRVLRKCAIELDVVLARTKGD